MVPDAAALPEPLRSCVLSVQHVTPAVDLAGWNLGRAQAVSVLADGDVVDDACDDVPGASGEATR